MNISFLFHHLFFYLNNLNNDGNGIKNDFYRNEISLEIQLISNIKYFDFISVESNIEYIKIIVLTIYFL